MDIKTAFLGGFTYTEAEICKCGHGNWDHSHSPSPGKKVWGVGKCGFPLCKCNKFVSKIEAKEPKIKTKKPK
jgi:hypothetical protein